MENTRILKGFMSEGADDFIVRVINGLLLHVNDDKERTICWYIFIIV